LSGYQEFYPTTNDYICTGLTAGSKSNWFKVDMNLYHNIFVSITGVTATSIYKITHCPIIDEKAGSDWESNARADNQSVSITADGVRAFTSIMRTGYFRIDFISGAGTIKAYYFGGR